MAVDVSSDPSQAIKPVGPKHNLQTNRSTGFTFFCSLFFLHFKETGQLNKVSQTVTHKDPGKPELPQFTVNSLSLCLHHIICRPPTVACCHVVEAAALS